MALTIASARLSDAAFLEAFRSCELPLSCFRHGDHLRFAWLQIHQESFPDALASIRNGIRTYAAHHGVPHIFHETVTRAWVMLLATHGEPDFTAFLTENEPRLNVGLLHRFWTPELLASDAARLAWLPPDRAALPM